MGKPQLFFIVLLALIILAPTVAFGVPASPDAMEVVQPDGAVVKVYQRGDEWNNWVETLDGYTIEKVLLETWPGFFLGGNLYVPTTPGKHPAVVSPHGHWNYGRLEHQPLASIPMRAANLAKRGHVVFIYDMVGYNDTMQVPHSFNIILPGFIHGYHILGIMIFHFKQGSKLPVTR